MYNNQSDRLYPITSSYIHTTNRTLRNAINTLTTGETIHAVISLLLGISSFFRKNFHIRKIIITSTKIIINSHVTAILKALLSAPQLFGRTIKENILHKKLAIIAFFRDIPSQYFIIIASTVATKISHITTYHAQFHIISGNTNRNNGRVTVVGITHRKMILLLDIRSSFRNIFAIKNKTNVSIITASDQ
ncbi:hypothetical protein J6T66_01080 [bacterium]|nr:hypothetical protein [bacterium]